MGLTQKIWGQIGSWSSSILQVASGGTGASTLADGGIVIGNGTSAVEVVAPGATTEILVGGGAATKPVWTTATGTGAPVRAISPTLVTPTIGVATATSVNGLSLTANSTGFSVAGGTTSKSLTVELDSVVNQDLSTDANPTFGNLTITSMAGNWTNAGRTVADGGTVTTIDINGGAIDGTTIGANSAAAITCTTLNTGGKLTAGANEIECSNVDITGGSITGITDLAVADGGTGASTLTDHGILLGSDTDAVTPMSVLATGEVVVGVTGADPKALAAQTAASRKFLHQTGTGTAGQDPTWETIISGDLTTALTTPPAIGGTTPAAGSFTTLNATVKDYIYLYIDAGLDGASAPSVAVVTSSTNKIVTRSFPATGDTDLFFHWQPPFDWDGGTITFRVIGFVTNATAPANTETVIFALKGGSFADSDILSTALGSLVNATFTSDATYAQYDRWSTGWSNAVTIANATKGETVILNLSRDVDDTYEQPIGVVGLEIKFTRNLAQ